MFYKLTDTYNFYLMLFDGSDAPKTGEQTNLLVKILSSGGTIVDQTSGSVTRAQVDSTNFPGLYKVSFQPSAIDATGYGQWAIRVSHATYAVKGWFETPVFLANSAAELPTETIDGYTPRQHLAIITATTVAKCSGEPSNPVTFRSANDSANRVVSSIDADGNRTTVTINAP